MNRILVSTDFSPTAETALLYAIKLAGKLNGSIVLMHSIFPEKATSENGKGSLFSQSENNLKRTAEPIARAQINFELYTSQEEVSNAICTACEKYNINLIIMGTKGESNLASEIFGSNTAAAINNAKCPVIAVPVNTVFSDIKRISYASDYRNSDIEILKHLITLASPDNAQVDILHIVTESEDANQDVEYMRSFMNRVNQEINYNNLSFQLKNGDVSAVLTEFLEQGGCDLLALSTHQRNWWDKLFDRSISRELVHNSSTPIIVFHHNKNSELKLI